MRLALEWAATARSHANDCASSTRVSHCRRKSQLQSAGRVCTNDSAATHRTFCGQYVAVARRYALCTNTHCSSNSAAALSRLSVRVRFLAGATVMEVVRAAHAFTQTSLRGALPLNSAGRNSDETAARESHREQRQASDGHRGRATR